jgi:PAS domain S-box-containing protein
MIDRVHRAPVHVAEWKPADGSAGAAAERRHHGLWWACVVVVLAIGAVQVYDVVHRHDIVTETAERDFTSLVRVLAEHAARAVQAVDVVVRDTAAEVSIMGMPANRQALQQRLRDRIVAIAQVEALAIVGADGTVFAAAGQHPPSFVAPAELAYLAVQRDGRTRGLYVSEAFRQPGNGRWTVAVSRRIEGRSDAFLGVAVAYLDLDYFDRFYGAVEIGAGRQLQLLRRDGVLLAGYPPGASAVGRSLITEPVYRELLAAPEGPTAVRQAVVDGEDRIIAAQAVPGLPLSVIASADKSVVLAAWHVSAMHSAVRTTLLCGGVLLLMWLVLRQLRRRERAEERLRVESAHLDELFESAPEAIVMLDLDGRVTRVNREFTRMFGYSAADAAGRMLAQLIVPEDLEHDAERIAQAVAHGRRTSRETECVDQQGRRLHVSMLGAPIVTSSGQIASYAIYRDMTERVLAEAERARLESRVRHGEKLEAIGTMAGGIAHDFNNILAAMLGYLEMALAAPPDNAVMRRHVTNVMKAAHRARALVDQILSYSRTTRGKSEAVNLHAVVEETLELVRASLPDHIELRAQLAPSKGITVIADATHIHQLVMNLCTNAVHAMVAGGVLSVDLDTIDLPDDLQLSHGQLPAGRYVRLTVEDSGCGMERETIQRIFEPFFTTKAAGMGTGLGLALVHGMITELGGAIDVTSSPDQGSRFEIYLPRSDAPAMQTVDQARSWTRGQGERILIVDDERFLMLLAEEMLAALCYEPAGFTRADEALQEFLADPQRIDGALLDHVMPGITGIELARRLREVRPDLPIVLVSGYMGPLLEQDAALAGIDRILTKPLDLNGLSQAIAQVLSEKVKA